MAVNATAQFSDLNDIAVDSEGNLYIVDGGSIRKMTRDGKLATIYINQIEEPRFFYPTNKVYRIALDAQGNIYALAGYSVKKLSANGVLTDVVAELRGTNCPTQNYQATDLVIDRSGNIIATFGMPSEVLKIFPNGRMDHVFKKEMDSNCQPIAYDSFSQSFSLVIDQNGELVIGGKYTAWKMVDGQPVSIISKAEGTVAAHSITMAKDGNIYYGARVQGGARTGGHVNYISRINTDGTVTFVAGKWVNAENSHEPNLIDATGREAKFAMTSILAASPDGNIYVADRDNYAIRRVTPEGKVDTIAGVPGKLGSSD